MRQIALDRGLPSALLITQPKSASISIGSILGGFALPTVVYSLTAARVVLPWAMDFSRGGGGYVTHLEPTVENIELLQLAGLRKVLVNVRDPRGQMVSAIHHIIKYRYELPSAFAAAWTNKTNDERIDEMIDKYLSTQIDWINRWVVAGKKLDVRFSTYEQFVQDRDAFLENLLENYGGDTRFFDRHAAFRQTTGIDYHIRKGTVDSWKSELSHDQIERINRKIPDSWWRLFGWTP